MTSIYTWAGRSSYWVLRWVRHSGIYFVVGMFVCWITLNALAGPGVAVLEQAEEEGPQFSDPATLDVGSTIKRSRWCAGPIQPWIWRTLNKDGGPWKEGDGRKKIQAMPLQGIVAPFLAPDGDFILTLPSKDVPDPEHGGWLYRTVRAEQCSFLPSQLGALFGTRLIPSKDVPVNFVGAPHDHGK